MDGELVFAFTVGAVSSVNPCGFALLPARRLGVTGETESGLEANLASALASGGAAAAGVIVAFAIAGIAVLAGVSWLGGTLPWAGLAIGVALVGVAVYVLVGRHVGVRIPLPASWNSVAGLPGDFLFGFGYGVASLSCTFPIFLSVTAIATTGSLVESFGGFLAFGVGMGAVIMAIALAAAASRSGLANVLKKLLPYINRFSGVVLLLAGLYVVVYWASALFSDDPFNPPGVIAQGEQLSNWLTSVVGGSTVPGILAAVMIGSAVAAGLVLRRRSKRRRGADVTPSPSEGIGR